MKISSFQVLPMTSCLGRLGFHADVEADALLRTATNKREKGDKKLQGERVVKTGHESTTTGRITPALWLIRFIFPKKKKNLLKLKMLHFQGCC